MVAHPCREACVTGSGSGEPKRCGARPDYPRARQGSMMTFASSHRDEFRGKSFIPLLNDSLEPFSHQLSGLRHTGAIPSRRYHARSTK